LIRSLQKVLHHLVIQEHVDSRDIVILTPRSEERTYLKPGTRVGNFTLAGQSSSENNFNIQVTSVYKFKGLEKRVVILAEIDNRYTYNPTMIMYVGCSRARTHLIFIHDETAPPGMVHGVHG